MSLNAASLRVESEFTRLWWYRVCVPSNVRDTTIGVGVKCVSDAQLAPPTVKKPRKVDICDQLDELLIGSKPFKTCEFHPVPSAQVSIESITAKLETLALCECKSSDCVNCVLEDLGMMVEGVMLVHHYLRNVAEQTLHMKPTRMILWTY